MNDKHKHPYIATLYDQLARRRIDRREFLRTSTLLGLSATAAYAAVGKVQALAQSASKPKGGILRIGMACQDLSTPHTYSWVESSNSGRAKQRMRMATSRDQSVRSSIRSSSAPSAQCASSRTTTCGRRLA